MSDDAPGLSTSHDPVQNAILLMGPTGTGKSSFITRTTDEYAPVGDTLDSCLSRIFGDCDGLLRLLRAGTKKCEAYKYSYGGRNLLLIDTPGFDDRTEDEMATLH